MDDKTYIFYKFDLMPEDQAEVLDAVKTLAVETRKEPGCISYMLTQDKISRNTFCFVECWATEKDFEAHLETAHYKAFEALAGDKLENRLLSKLEQCV